MATIGRKGNIVKKYLRSEMISENLNRCKWMQAKNNQRHLQCTWRTIRFDVEGRTPVNKIHKNDSFG